MIKWRCGVCGYIHDGETPPEKCPKCGAPREKFEKLGEEEGSKVERSRLTNVLLSELLLMSGRMTELAEEGLEDALDPACVLVFKKAAQVATELGQSAKAEIQTHVARGKWG